LEACALCLPNTGNNRTSRMEGVTPAKSADQTACLLKPSVHPVSF
jgi:hypothetical protein